MSNSSEARKLAESIGDSEVDYVKALKCIALVDFKSASNYLDKLQSELESLGVKRKQDNKEQINIWLARMQNAIYSRNEKDDLMYCDKLAKSVSEDPYILNELMVAY